jgi:hypothetical protein
MPALPAIAHDLRGLDRLARVVVYLKHRRR